jgi:ubiquinone/menaquinone biosynthesis C-methylase UbiE
MSRFRQYGCMPIGLDVAPKLVKFAGAYGPVIVASGLQIPVADNTFDVVYIQHVLHHIKDVQQALRETYRCSKVGGILFLIETLEDNPLIHWGRRLCPRWLGNEVNAFFYFDELREALSAAGFQVRQAQQYSVLFWLWEALPDQLPFTEKLTPIFVTFERLLVRFFRQQSAHCFLVATKEEKP